MSEPHPSLALSTLKVGDILHRIRFLPNGLTSSIYFVEKITPKTLTIVNYEDKEKKFEYDTRKLPKNKLGIPLSIMRDEWPASVYHKSVKAGSRILLNHLEGVIIKKQEKIEALTSTYNKIQKSIYS